MKTLNQSLTIMSDAIQPRYLLPIDGLPATISGYSIARVLRSGYSGPLIKVRRSLGDNELDIGSDSSGRLDTTELLNFCGSGSGFITALYDQGTNARHLLQPLASAQPQIVVSGVLQTENGAPCAVLNGTSHFLSNTIQFLFDNTVGCFSSVVYRQRTATGCVILGEGNSSTITPFYHQITTATNALTTRVAIRSNTSLSQTPGVLDGTSSSSIAGLRVVTHIDAVNSLIGYRNSAFVRNTSYTRPTGGVTLNTFSLGCILRTTASSFAPINFVEMLCGPYNTAVLNPETVRQVAGNQSVYFGVTSS